MYSQARQSSDPFMSKQEVFIINQSRRPLDLLIYSSTLFFIIRSSYRRGLFVEPIFFHIHVGNCHDNGPLYALLRYYSLHHYWNPSALRSDIRPVGNVLYTVSVRELSFYCSCSG